MQFLDNGLERSLSVNFGAGKLGARLSPELSMRSDSGFARRIAG